MEHIGNSNLPFGGVGDSGMGAYHGKWGFDEFTHKRAVMVKVCTGYTACSVQRAAWCSLKPMRLVVGGRIFSVVRCIGCFG